MDTFVRVVGAGSFSAAARQMGRSKARVSQTISALEADLGVVLLQRTTRSLKLTDQGSTYFTRAAELVGEVDALEAAVKRERGELEGRLRVTAPPGLVARHLSVLTTSFRKKHPKVDLDLDLTHRMVNLVEESIDVAIRVSELADSSLIAKKIAPAPVVAVASPGYLERHGRPRTPADLREHACLVDTNFRDQQRWKFVHRGKKQTVSVTGPFRVNSPVAIRELALDGQGVALIAKFAVDEDLRRGRLVEVLRNKVAMAWSIYALHPRREYTPARVRAYIDHLVDALC